MKRLFFNEKNELRNGWKIFIFLLVFSTLNLALNQLFRPTEILTYEFLFLLSVVISTFVIMGLFEKKHLLEIGLKIERKTAYEIYFGLILGFLMISVVVVVNIIFENYKYELTPNQIVSQIFESILFFLLVALAEEILFRGYPFQRLIDGTSPLTAAIVFSLLFALAHLGNPNVNSIALINIFLAGIWLSSAYIKTRSLWLPISLHFSWNFFQGYLFSLPVSGTSFFETAFNVEITSENLLSGGNFGPEGSILTSLVLIIATVIILKNKRLNRE